MLRMGLIMAEAVRGLGATETLRSYRLQALWEGAVGQLLAGVSETTGVKGSTLFVRTAGASWSQEIMLRQSEILGRLRLEVELREIRCKVGRLSHEPRRAPARVERTVEWEAYQPEPEALSRIDSLVAQVEDQLLGQKLRRFLMQVERRRLWAARQGWLACARCGVYHPEPLTLCRPCSQEQQRLRRQRLLRELGRRPWLTLNDLVQDFPGLPLREFLRARQNLRSIWQEEARLGLREAVAGEPIPPGLRARLLDLCQIATGIPYQQLQAKHVHYALGRQIGKAYVEDRVPAREEQDKASWGMRGRWKRWAQEKTPPQRKRRSRRPKA